MGIRLAFSAKAGSGKSKAIQLIRENLYSPKFINVKFADDLYEIMHLVQDHLGMQRHKDGRFLQLIGSEWGRSKDKDIWVNRFKDKIDKISKENPDCVIVCDDVRMVNEFFCAQNLGFTMIRIKRNLDLRQSSLLNRDCNHPSETEQDLIPDESFDHVIYNNGSVEHLRQKLLQIIHKECHRDVINS